MTELFANPAVTMAVGGVAGVVAAWAVAKIRTIVRGTENKLDDAIFDAIVDAIAVSKAVDKVEAAQPGIDA